MPFWRVTVDYWGAMAYLYCDIHAGTLYVKIDSQIELKAIFCDETCLGFKDTRSVLDPRRCICGPDFVDFVEQGTLVDHPPLDGLRLRHWSGLADIFSARGRFACVAAVRCFGIRAVV